MLSKARGYPDPVVGYRTGRDARRGARRENHGGLFKKTSVEPGVDAQGRRGRRGVRGGVGARGPALRGALRPSGIKRARTPLGVERGIDAESTRPFKRERGIETGLRHARTVRYDYVADACRRISEDGECLRRSKRLVAASVSVSLESQARTLEEQRRMDAGELEQRPRAASRTGGSRGDTADAGVQTRRFAATPRPRA